MNVVLADDQPRFREAMRALLDASGRVKVVAEAADGEQAIRATLLHRPHLVLMDVRMPGVDGIEATRRIVAEMPGARVLVLTTFDEDELVRTAIGAGAVGYLLKAMPPDDLLSAMELARLGYATLAPGAVARAATAPPTDRRLREFLARARRLTPREREILALLSEGRTNGEIAEATFLALGTVKNVVSAVLSTLGLRHRTEAAILARLAPLAASPEPPPDGA